MLIRATPSALASLLFCFSSCCIAHDYGVVLIENPPTRPTLFLGISVYKEPTYLGSDLNRNRLEPLLELYTNDGKFINYSSGAGINFSNSTSWQYGVSIDPREPYKISKSARQGLMKSEINAPAETGYRLETGPFLNYMPIDGLMLLSSMKAGAARSRDGVTADIGVLIGAPIAERITLSYLAAIKTANSAFSQNYFGVSSTGIKSASSIFSVEYDFSRAWSISITDSRATLLRDAKLSPATINNSGTSYEIEIEYQYW